MKSKKKGKFMMGMGLLLTAAALFLTIYTLWGEYQAKVQSETALGLVMEQIAVPETVSESAQPVGTEGISENGTNPEVEEDAGKEMTVKFIEGQEYIGVIEIPELSLKLPVISEWNDERLKIAPCRYLGSAYSGDLIISGHSYKNHFRYIRKLEQGDTVIFTDMDGNRFVYEVTGTEVIEETNVEQMEAGEWDLTLFTCTPNGSSRHTVRCTLVEDESSWIPSDSIIRYNNLTSGSLFLSCMDVILMKR